MALNDRKHGSRCPEGWLSLTGTVAQMAPEYSYRTKLLLPMMLMLAGVMIIVIIPVMLEFQNI